MTRDRHWMAAPASAGAVEAGPRPARHLPADVITLHRSIISFLLRSRGCVLVQLSCSLPPGAAVPDSFTDGCHGSGVVSQVIVSDIKIILAGFSR